MLVMNVPSKWSADLPEGINHSASNKGVAESITRQSGNINILNERRLESAAWITTGSRRTRKCVPLRFMCSRLYADLEQLQAKEICANSAHPFTPSTEEEDITLAIKEPEVARNVPIPIPFIKSVKITRNFQGKEPTECCQRDDGLLM